MDGNRWGGGLIEEPIRGTATSSGYLESATGLCPYTFAKVNLTGIWHAVPDLYERTDQYLHSDDDAFLASSNNANVGVIKLNITRVEVLGHVPFTPVVPPLQQAVHERSKKGADHQVQ